MYASVKQSPKLQIKGEYTVRLQTLSLTQGWILSFKCHHSRRLMSETVQTWIYTMCLAFQFWTVPKVRFPCIHFSKWPISDICIHNGNNNPHTVTRFGYQPGRRDNLAWNNGCKQCFAIDTGRKRIQIKAIASRSISTVSISYKSNYYILTTFSFLGIWFNSIDKCGKWPLMQVMLGNICSVCVIFHFFPHIMEAWIQSSSTWFHVFFPANTFMLQIQSVALEIGKKKSEMGQLDHSV